MDFSIIIDFIQSVGYPIAMSMIMLWYMMKENESNRQQNAAMVEAINNNTIVLTRVVEKLGDLDGQNS